MVNTNLPQAAMSHTLENAKSSPITFFNLAATALILVISGLGVAYWLVASAQPQLEPSASTYSAPFVQKTLAGTKIQFPEAWLNRETQSGRQTVDFIDLKLLVQFEPDAGLSELSLHLAQQGASQPSAILLDSVYALRFTQKQLIGPQGLIGKPLRAEQGFQNETVWYDPVSPRPFAAKCLDFGTSNSAANCLRTVQVSPRIMVTYQFNETQLVYWRNFDAVMEQYLSALGI